ncbi:hypothetical protein D7Y13_39475 [Corallococcus praedator]|uniref:Immunity MXAN-0049 protein domain-containing protein n=2 Tax=Myxococcaceae TaxID=31 RepID=A0ABX9Q5M9_9BACT|nr:MULTISPECIES: DUF1629 domain-containing protein [Corallococcus]RKH14396.1 hypothetical protein D7X74_20185 [Corallococcus sp. CA047B]RKH21903.1 hypothetical protein D7X75_36515 [Corallococcus sp. CA031C]RKH90739.1 hypothetical protein D7Y13_39475 [Corallococcus praedator]
MAARYFELRSDVQEENWYLDDPVDANSVEVDNPWMFGNGKPIPAPGYLRIPIMEPGRPQDFSLAGVGMTPIVHVKIATVLAERAANDVQLFSVDIQGHPDQYVLFVATKLIRCINEKDSEEIRFWEARHGQPERIGEYRSVYGMRIDPSKAGDAQLFRPWGWSIALIVSEDLKDALERTGATGMHFTEV